MPNPNNVIFIGERKKVLKSINKQARINKNYQDCYELAQMLVARPICRKICISKFKYWEQIVAKIQKRNWDKIRPISPFFADNKLDLWESECECGSRQCKQYMADRVCLFPSDKQVIPPNPQLMFEYDSEEVFDYHFDGDDQINKSIQWKYPS